MTMSALNSTVIDIRNESPSVTVVPAQEEKGNLMGREVVVQNSYNNKAKFRAGVGPGMFDGICEGAAACCVFCTLGAGTLAAGLAVGFTKNWTTGGIILGSGFAFSICVAGIVFCVAKVLDK